MGNADNVLFDNDSRVAPLGLIAMAGASELGKKVDGYLTKWANENEFVKDTLLRLFVLDFLPATARALSSHLSEATIFSFSAT